MLWLAEDGKVLTWGHGGHGQLGHGDLANAKTVTPKVVEALEGQQAVSVACGRPWTWYYNIFPWSIIKLLKSLNPGLTKGNVEPTYYIVSLALLIEKTQMTSSIAAKIFRRRRMRYLVVWKLEDNIYVILGTDSQWTKSPFL